MKIQLRRFSAAMALMTVAVTSSIAPARADTYQVYDIEWSGAIYGNTATISALATIDVTLLNNFNTPASGALFTTLSPYFTSLMLTVTGSGAGDGTFGLSDFNAFYFYTNHATLDLNADLVGQPTSALPWGTCVSCAQTAGDFNFFNSNPNAPSQGNSIEEFTQITDGGHGLPTHLVSFAPVPGPTVGAGASSFALGALFLGWLVRRRKQIV